MCSKENIKDAAGFSLNKEPTHLYSIWSAFPLFICEYLLGQILCFSQDVPPLDEPWKYYVKWRIVIGSKKQVYSTIIWKTIHSIMPLLETSRKGKTVKKQSKFFLVVT